MSFSMLMEYLLLIHNQQVIANLIYIILIFNILYSYSSYHMSITWFFQWSSHLYGQTDIQLQRDCIIFVFRGVLSASYSREKMYKQWYSQTTVSNLQRYYGKLFFISLIYQYWLLVIGLNAYNEYRRVSDFR